MAELRLKHFHLHRSTKVGLAIGVILVAFSVIYWKTGADIEDAFYFSCGLGGLFALVLGAWVSVNKDDKAKWEYALERAGLTIAAITLPVFLLVKCLAQENFM